MTVEILAQILCLASGIFGRPAWDASKCQERAAMICTSAERHGVDPLLMVAIDIQECDLHDRDNPVYREIQGRRRLVGYDRCPMGVRILDVRDRASRGPAELYEMAAVKLARWSSWHSRARHRGHHFVSHYNPGNPVYADQVLAVWAMLGGRRARGDLSITSRTVEILRRLARALRRQS